MENVLALIGLACILVLTAVGVGLNALSQRIPLDLDLTSLARHVKDLTWNVRALVIIQIVTILSIILS